jgi:hypothetical protein
MKRDLDKLAAAAALSAAMIATGPAAAQKQGGILRAGHFDSPDSTELYASLWSCHKASPIGFGAGKTEK